MPNVGVYMIYNGKDVEVSFGGKVLKFERDIDKALPLEFANKTFRGSMQLTLNDNSFFDKVKADIVSLLCDEVDETILALMAGGVPQSNIEVIHKPSTQDKFTNEIIVRCW